MNVKLFVAAKGIVVRDGKVLVVRESSKYDEGTRAGEWDVPGGRIDPGEALSDAARREVLEETGLDVEVRDTFFANEATPRPVVNGEEWQIVRIFFECIADFNDVKLSDDHDEHKWIDPRDYKRENVIENLAPAFEAYVRKYLS